MRCEQKISMCFRAFLQDPDEDAAEGLVSLTPEERDCCPSFEDGMLSPVYPYPLTSTVKGVVQVPKDNEVETPSTQNNGVKTFNIQQSRYCVDGQISKANAKESSDISTKSTTEVDVTGVSRVTSSTTVETSSIKGVTTAESTDISISCRKIELRMANEVSEFTDNKIGNITVENDQGVSMSSETNEILHPLYQIGVNIAKLIEARNNIVPCDKESKEGQMMVDNGADGPTGTLIQHSDGKTKSINASAMSLCPRDSFPLPTLSSPPLSAFSTGNNLSTTTITHDDGDGDEDGCVGLVSSLHQAHDYPVTSFVENEAHKGNYSIDHNHLRLAANLSFVEENVISSETPKQKATLESIYISLSGERTSSIVTSPTLTTTSTSVAERSNQIPPFINIVSSLSPNSKSFLESLYADSSPPRVSLFPSNSVYDRFCNLSAANSSHDDQQEGYANDDDDVSKVSAYNVNHDLEDLELTEVFDGDFSASSTMCKVPVVKFLMESLFETTSDVITPLVMSADESQKQPETFATDIYGSIDQQCRVNLTSAEKKQFSMLLGCSVDSPERELHSSSVYNDNENQLNSLAEECDFIVTPTKEISLKIPEHSTTHYKDKDFTTALDPQSLSKDDQKVDDLAKDTPQIESRELDGDLLETAVDDQPIEKCKRLTKLPYLVETEVIKRVVDEDELNIQVYLNQCDGILQEHQSESSQVETDFDESCRKENIPITFVTDSMVKNLHNEKRHSNWRKKCYSLRHDFKPVYEDILTDDEFTKLKKNHDERFAYRPIFEYVTMDEGEETDDVNDERNTLDLNWRQRKPLKSFVNTKVKKEMQPRSPLIPIPDVGGYGVDSKIQNLLGKQPTIRVKKMKKPKVKRAEASLGKTNENESQINVKETSGETLNNEKEKKFRKKMSKKNKRKRVKKKQEKERLASGSWSAVLSQPDQLFSDVIFKIPRIKLTKEVHVVDADRKSKKPSSLKVKKEAKSLEVVPPMNNVSRSTSTILKSTNEETTSTSTRSLNRGNQKETADQGSVIKAFNNSPFAGQTHLNLSGNEKSQGESVQNVQANGSDDTLDTHSRVIEPSKSGNEIILKDSNPEPQNPPLQQSVVSTSLSSSITDQSIPIPVTSVLKELVSPEKKFSFADFIAKKKIDLSLKSQASTTNRVMSQSVNPIENPTTQEDLTDFVDKELERQIDERFGKFKRSTDSFSPKTFSHKLNSSVTQRQQVLSETILKLRRLRNQEVPLLKHLDVTPVLKEIASPEIQVSLVGKSASLQANTAADMDLNLPKSVSLATKQSLELLSPTSSVVSMASNETETCLIETISGNKMKVKKSYLKYPHCHEDGTKCATRCSRLPTSVVVSDSLNQKERDAPSKAYFKFPHRHSDGTYCETVCSRVLTRENQRASFSRRALEVSKPRIIPWKLIQLTIPKKNDLVDPRLLPKTAQAHLPLNPLDPRISPSKKLASLTGIVEMKDPIDTFIPHENQVESVISTFPDQRESLSSAFSSCHENEVQDLNEQNMDLCYSEIETQPNDERPSIQGSVLFDSLDKRKKSKKIRWDIPSGDKMVTSEDIQPSSEVTFNDSKKGIVNDKDTTDIQNNVNNMEPKQTNESVALSESSEPSDITGKDVNKNLSDICREKSENTKDSTDVIGQVKEIIFKEHYNNECHANGETGPRECLSSYTPEQQSLQTTQHSYSDYNHFVTNSTESKTDYCENPKPVKKMKMPALPFVFDASDTEDENNNFRNSTASQDLSAQTNMVVDESSLYHSERYVHQPKMKDSAFSYSDNWYHGYSRDAHFQYYPTNLIRRNDDETIDQDHYPPTESNNFAKQQLAFQNVSGRVNEDPSQDFYSPPEPTPTETKTPQQSDLPKDSTCHSFLDLSIENNSFEKQQLALPKVSIKVSSKDLYSPTPTESTTMKDTTLQPCLVTKTANSCQDLFSPVSANSFQDLYSPISSYSSQDLYSSLELSPTQVNNLNGQSSSLPKDSKSNFSKSSQELYSPTIARTNSSKQPISPKEDTPASTSSFQDLYSPTQPTPRNKDSAEGTPVLSPNAVKTPNTTPPTFRSDMNPLKVLSGGDNQLPPPTAFPFSPLPFSPLPFSPLPFSTPSLNYYPDYDSRWYFGRQNSDSTTVTSPLEWSQQQQPQPSYSNFHGTNEFSPSTQSMWTVFQRLFNPPSSNKSFDVSTGGPLSRNDNESLSPLRTLQNSRGDCEEKVSSLWPASSPTSLSSNPQILNMLNHLILQSLDDLIHEYFDEWPNLQEKTYLLEFSRGFVLGSLDKQSVASESELLQIIVTGIRDALASVQKRKQEIVCDDTAASPEGEKITLHADESTVEDILSRDRPRDPRKGRPTSLSLYDTVSDPPVKRRRVSMDSKDAFPPQYTTPQRRFFYDSEIPADPDMYKSEDTPDFPVLEDTDVEEGEIQPHVFSAKLPIQKKRKRNKKKKSRYSLDSLESPNRDCLRTIDIQVQVNNRRRRIPIRRNVVVDSNLRKKNPPTPAPTKIFPKDLTSAKLSLEDIEQLNRMNFKAPSIGGVRNKRGVLSVGTKRETAENDLTGERLRNIRNSTAPSFYKSRKAVVQNKKKSNSGCDLRSRLDHIHEKRVSQKKRSSFM